MNKIKIAVFASGSGSNFEAIVKASKEINSFYEVVLIVCDKEQAKVIERAKGFHIPAFTFQPSSYTNKESYEKAIKNQLVKKKVEFIALAGYMRLIGKTLLEAYEGEIVNIHPSLLPAFPGKDAIGQAIHKGVKVSGVTIHYVDEGMDTGPIIAQQAVVVEDGDSKDTLQRKIQKIEHELYPKVLQQLCEEKRRKGDRVAN